MSFITSVDLAAKFSGVCTGTRSGQVHADFNSIGLTPFSFLDKLVETVADFDSEIVLVEDLPYNLKFMSQIKPPLRMQGLLIRTFGEANLLDRVLWMPPADWQRPMGVFGKTTPTAAEQAKQEFGYDVPDLFAEHAATIQSLKGKERTDFRASLKKAQTDHADAYLMYQWMRRVDLQLAGPWPSNNVQPTFM